MDRREGRVYSIILRRNKAVHEAETADLPFRGVRALDQELRALDQESQRYQKAERKGRDLSL